MSLSGPTVTETITGGKTLEMSDYDKTPRLIRGIRAKVAPVRAPHPAITDNAEIKITTRTLATELCCPICLDLLTSTMTTKECLHRFCAECITTALMRGNKECPTCRKKIVSKRSLRPDPNFDALISKIWPDRKVYEEMQAEAAKRFLEQNNVEALQKSIEAGMKEQAVHRRQRVQGSYDYEKRKRRPRLDQSAATSSTLGAENQTGEDVEMQDVENLQENGTPQEEERAIQTRRPQLVRMQSNGVTSSTDESDMSSDSTDTSSEISDTGSSDASSATTIASTSKQEPPPQPPTARCSLKDKMNKWLDGSSSSPLTPSDDNIVEPSTDGMSDEIRRRLEEIEVELVPSKSLLKRKNFPESLTMNRFIRTSADVTMGHLSEFLKEVCNENSDVNGNIKQESDIKGPEYFYVTSREDQVRKVFLHETLYTAFMGSTPTSDHHLVIFFDTSPPDVNCPNLFAEIVGNEGVKFEPVEPMEE